MSSLWRGSGVHFNGTRGTTFVPHRDAYLLTLLGEAGTVTGRGHHALEDLSKTRCHAAEAQRLMYISDLSDDVSYGNNGIVSKIIHHHELLNDRFSCAVINKAPLARLEGRNKKDICLGLFALEPNNRMISAADQSNFPVGTVPFACAIETV
jgi:hypothetical protein